MLQKTLYVFFLLMSFSWQTIASECSPYNLSKLDGKTTSRVKLQFIKTSSDIQRLREMLSHPEMDSFYYADGKINPGIKEETVIEHINGVLPSKYNGITGYFGVYVSNELVGFAGLSHFLEENQATIQYAIAPEHQGQGLATESARMLIQFAFENLKVDSVTAGIHRSNKASIKVVEKVGLVRDEESEGLFESYDHYYLNKEDFSP